MAADGSGTGNAGRGNGRIFNAASGLFSWASSSAPATGNHAGPSASTTAGSDNTSGMASDGQSGAGPQSHPLGVHQQPHSSQSHHGFSHARPSNLNSSQGVMHTPRQAQALPQVQTVNSYSLGEHDPHQQQQHLLSPGERNPQEYQMLQSPVHHMQPRSPFGSKSTPASAAQHLPYQQHAPQQQEAQIFAHNVGFPQEQSLQPIPHAAHVVVDDHTPQQALYSHPHLQHLGLISPQQRDLSLKYPTQDPPQVQTFQYMPHPEITHTHVDTPVGRQLRSSRAQDSIARMSRIDQNLASYETHESGYDTQASTWHDAQTLQQLRDGGIVNQGFSTVGSSRTSASHNREEVVVAPASSVESDAELDRQTADKHHAPSSTGADVIESKSTSKKRKATPFAEKPRKSGRPKDFVWGYFNELIVNDDSSVPKAAQCKACGWTCEQPKAIRMRQHVINCDNISVVDRKQQAFLHESKRLKSARKRSQRVGNRESPNIDDDRVDTAVHDDDGNVDASGVSLEQPGQDGGTAEEGPSVEVEGNSGITVEEAVKEADDDRTRAHKRRKKDKKHKKQRAAEAAAAAAAAAASGNQHGPSELKVVPVGGTYAASNVTSGPLAHLQGLQTTNRDNRPTVYPYADAIQPDLEEIIPRRTATTNVAPLWATSHPAPVNPYIISQAHAPYMPQAFHPGQELHAVQSMQQLHQMDASSGIQPFSTLKNPHLEAQLGRQHLYTMYGIQGSPGGMSTYINPTDGSLNLSASLLGSSTIQDINGKKRKRKIDFMRPPGVAIAPFTLGDTALSNMTNTAVRSARPPITCHVLDSSIGKPGSDIQVRLEQLMGTGYMHIITGQTDLDGRSNNLLEPGTALDRDAVYKLTFYTREYFSNRGVSSFYPTVEVTFQIADPTEHYHIAVLMSPWSYTTYRGS